MFSDPYLYPFGKSIIQHSIHLFFNQTVEVSPESLLFGGCEPYVLLQVLFQYLGSIIEFTSETLAL